MTYKYFPHTEQDVKEMLDVIGVNSLDDLYAELPEEVKFNKEYNLPSAMSEIEVRKRFQQLGEKNRTLTVFAGAGSYDHYTPSVIPYLTQRSEFLTSYTPYQAEISQGTLQYIFEYQSMMAELTGMDVSNASMYDGATATAEAALMAVAASHKRNRVLISETINPSIVRVVATYCKYHGVQLDTIAELNGKTDIEDLKTKLSSADVAGVIVGIPNYYGIVEDYSGFADLCHANKALFIINGVISDYSILKTPGEWGADIAVGDGQSLGVPMSFGGSYIGYLCCRKELIRKMPGRLVGVTKDLEGRRAFVLTLQAREQHIRRSKATSNICSNQGLMSLFVTIYLALMGPNGLREANEMSFDGAHYLFDKLKAVKGFKPAFDAPFFNEFCMRTSCNIDALQQRLLDKGFMGGVKVDKADMADCLLFAVTEQRTKDEIDRLVSLIQEEVER